MMLESGGTSCRNAISFLVKIKISSHQYLNYKFLNGEISTFTGGRNDILIAIYPKSVWV